MLMAWLPCWMHKQISSANLAYVPCWGTTVKYTTLGANRWWKYLDLEDYIYRPLLLKFLPTVCAAVCLVIDRLIDGFVIIMRKTIYKDSPVYKEMDEGNSLTYAFGKFFNKLKDVLNKTVWRRKPKEMDFVHLFALRYVSFKENFVFIGRSLSYGLILFCLGLCAVLIYLLVAAFG